MKIRVRFMTLTGKFAFAKEETFDTATQAFEAVKKYAESAGFTNVKIAEDDIEPDGHRYTAKTPGGRSGRNIAFGEFVIDDIDDISEE